MHTDILESLEPTVTHKISEHPLYTSSVSAGFPVPGEDHVAQPLDLNKHLIRHPAATFFVRASGDSMIGAGIFSGDLLIVDRSIEATHGKIVIVALDGQLTVKRLERHSKNKIRLVAENPAYPPIDVPDESQLHLWGVVLHAIHTV